LFGAQLQYLTEESHAPAPANVKTDLGRGFMQLRIPKPPFGSAPGDQPPDIDLLRSDPHALLLRHRNTVETIVKTNIGRGLFKPSDFEDVVQSVIEGLLHRLPKMQTQFRGESSFGTYLSRIVQNLSSSIADQMKRSPPTRELIEADASAPEDPIESHAIRAEVKRFQEILLLYPDKKRIELILCLKMYYRLPVQVSDLQGVAEVYSGDSLVTTLEEYNSRRPEMNDKEMYKLLTPIISRFAGKERKDDSLRRWVNVKIDEIVTFLNQRKPGQPYNKMLLQILVEETFHPISDSEESI